LPTEIATEQALVEVSIARIVGESLIG